MKAFANTQGLVIDTEDQDNRPGLIDSISGMSTNGKIVLGVAATAAVGLSIAGGAWWAGRKAGQVAAKVVETTTHTVTANSPAAAAAVATAPGQ